MAPKRNAPYTGPPVSEMLSTHTLADEIIARHNDPCPILDDAALRFLQLFCANPSPQNRDKLLEERDMLDAPGDAPGTRANKRWGSLVGYVIADYDGGVGGRLEEREVRLLREWFESGAADARMRGEEPEE